MAQTSKFSDNTGKGKRGLVCPDPRAEGCLRHYWPQHWGVWTMAHPITSGVPHTELPACNATADGAESSHRALIFYRLTRACNTALPHSKIGSEHRAIQGLMGRLFLLPLPPLRMQPAFSALTSTFSHASIGHLAFNMIAFSSFGGHLAQVGHSVAEHSRGMMSISTDQW